MRFWIYFEGQVDKWFKGKKALNRILPGFRPNQNGAVMYRDGKSTGEASARELHFSTLS